MHDIGKIAIDKDIINKPSSLTQEEVYELNQHPLISYKILSKVRFPWKGIPVAVRYHHERIDGGGYPDKLRGDEIPATAKIMAVADAFDAMTTNRPYRKRLALENVLLEIERGVGKQFDPVAAKGLFKSIEKEVKSEVKTRKVLAGIGQNLNPTIINQLLDRMFSQLSQIQITPSHERLTFYQ